MVLPIVGGHEHCYPKRYRRSAIVALNVFNLGHMAEFH